MKLRLIAACSLILVLGLTQVALAAGPDWSDNFNGGAQQAWTVAVQGDNSTYVFQNNRYELHTESGDGSAKALVSYVNATASNLVMHSRIQRIAGGDSFLAYLMARADTTNMNAYLLGASSSGTHYWFGKLVGGAYQELTPSFIETTSFDIADFQLRFAVFGNALLGKVWSSSAAEPDHWMIKATDASYASGVGGVMVATYPTLTWNIVQAAFDDVSLSTPSEVWVDDDWAGSSIGDMVGGHTFGYDGFATIQAGIDGVNAGGTVNVAAGTYNETITFGAAFAKDDLALVGDASNRPVVNGGVLFQNTSAFSGLSLSNLYLQGDAGTNQIVKNSNTGAINDFSIDNCVLDGGNVADRDGIAGNLFGGTLSITDSEFKNILGFAVMDIDSSTDSGLPWGSNGLPFTTITFANNHVHHCNGSVALRGDHTSKTATVSAHGNAYEYIGGNEGASGEQWAALEINHAQTVVVYNNTVDHVALGDYGEGQALQLFDVDTLDMHHNAFTNNYQGIWVFCGSSGGSYGGPYAVPGGSIYHNTISGNSEYGVAMEDTCTGTSLLNTEGNYWGSVVPLEVMAEVIGRVDYDPWCNSDFSACGYTMPVHNVTQGTHYPTIQMAVDDANAGDEIHADAGTYAEYVTINKNLTLIGSPGATIQKPSGDLYYKLPDEGTSKSFRPIVLAYGGSITGGDGASAATAYTIQGPETVNVTISGFRITANNAWTGATSSNFADGILLRNVVGTVASNSIDDMLPADTNQFTLGIEVRGDNSDITISGNTLTEFGRSGILVAGDLGTPVAEVTGNTVTAVYYGPYITNGIEMNYRSTGTVSDNMVTGASGSGTAWSGSGIMVYDSDGVTVSENSVSLCDVGISVGGRANYGYVSKNNVIEGNTVDQCLHSSIEINTNAINTTIRNNTITGVAARADTEDAGIVVLEYSDPLSSYPNGVLIEGNSISGDPGFWGIDIYRNADNVTIQNNIVTGGAVGIALELKEANSVGKNLTIGGATGKANSLTGQTVLTVSTGPYDYSGVTYQWTPDANASGNWFGSSDPATVKAAVSANVDYTPWLASGTDTSTDPGFQGDFSTLWVDDDSPQTGTTGRIQEGINLVSGSTVNVAAGTYVEQLLIQKSLILTGAGADQSIVKAPSGVRNGAPGATGAGTWVSDYLLAAYPASGTISVKVTGFTFDANNEIHQYSRFTGVLFKNVKGATKADAGLFSSKIVGFNVGDNSATGVRVLEDSRLTIDHNIVGYTINGIAVYGDNGPASDPQADVTYNTLNYLQPATTGYDEVGITFNWGVSGIIDHNTMANIPWGILVRAVNDSVVSNNMLTSITTGLPGTDPLTDNIGFVIDVEAGSSGNTISNNTITSSDVALVDTNGADNNTFTGNVVTNNKIGAWIGTYVDPMYPPATAPTGLQFHSNAFTGNTVAGLANVTSSTVDAERNWWGSACGPAGDGCGNGDKVLGNVDYSPWYADAGMTAQASEGPGGELVIPAGASTDVQQAILDCAAPGATVMWAVYGSTYPGGIQVNTNGLTLNLNGNTVGPGSPWLTVNADDVTVLGPGKVDGGGGGGAGILVLGGADNFILQGVEVTRWATGVELAGDVSSFKIVSNWIHTNSENGLGIDTGVDLGGIVTVEGNLFKNNTGPGIQHNGNGTLPAEYNSWGDPDGPDAGTGGDGIGGSVDADPWTYVESFFDVYPDTLALERHVPEETSFNVALKADAVNLYALTFKFTYDPTKLTLNSTAFSAPWTTACSLLPLLPPGTVAYYCYLTPPTPEWTATAGTVATLNFTANALTDDSPVESRFDIYEEELDTSAGAIGGQKVFVNNAGFNAPSASGRDITDTDDGRTIIERLANYSGFVDLQGRANDSGALFEVYGQAAKSGAVKLAEGTSASSGAYTTAFVSPHWLAAMGTYWFLVDRALYLPTTAIAAADFDDSKQLDGVPLTALAKVILLGGDATNNDAIEVGDLTCIGGAYGTPGGPCTGAGASDVNGDGIVNVQDLSMCGGNLYKTSSPWTP